VKTTIEPAEGTRLVYQRALPLSRQTLSFVADLLRAHLKKTGSRWRKLPPGRIALIVLATLRHDHRLAGMAGGNGVPASTIDWWTWEIIGLLAARAPPPGPRPHHDQKAGGEVVLPDGTPDWKKGSAYETAHEEAGLVVSGPEQVILESDPPRRLAYTWHTITPEWAAAVGMDEATAAAWRAETRSKVAFDIEDVGHGVVELTVTHDGLAPGSAVLPAISEGWPAVLASLKTLLETGSSLRTS
jgi:uncharacterized protein YndB with AHSA1/START domain